MKLKIEFFEGQLNRAVEAGIYGMYLSKHNEQQLLYIGESSSVIVRASQHLLELQHDPNYRGLTDKTIDDVFLTLSFELLKTAVNDKSLMGEKERKEQEKKLIAEAIESSDSRKRPLLQDGISDRGIKDRKERVKRVNAFIKEVELQ